MFYDLDQKALLTIFSVTSEKKETKTRKMKTPALSFRAEYHDVQGYRKYSDHEHERKANTLADLVMHP